MRIEDLWAFEQAMHDLGQLYASAREYTELADEAEKRLLPELQRLRTTLRGTTRTVLQNSRQESGELEPVAARLRTLLEEWRTKIAEQRRTRAYLAAREALDNAQWREAQSLLPKIFVCLSPAPPQTVVHVPVDLTRTQHRRSPGRFLTPPEAAQKLEEIVRHGLSVGPSQREDTDDELPYLEASARSEALASPTCLFATANKVQAAVLSDKRDPDRLRLYAWQIRAPWQVGIASHTEDEHWLAMDASYETYRDQLLERLAERGIPVRLL